MMPFISEELYQKFPEFEGKGTSICINSYPAENPKLDNVTVENDFNTVNQIAKTIRSLIANVNLPKSAHPACYALLLGDSESLGKLIESQAKLISTLTRTKSIEIVANEAAVPAGCIPNAVGSQLIVYINVKEYLDVKAEISRQEKKLNETEKMLGDAVKKTKIPNYETKVPASIQAANKEKIDSLNSQVNLLKEIIDILKKF